MVAVTKDSQVIKGTKQHLEQGEFVGSWKKIGLEERGRNDCGVMHWLTCYWTE